MMIYSKRQMSDTFLIAVLLAVVGGSLDAYSYVARGHVFANAQTGNIVLFGLHLADGEWMQAGTYIIPVLAFVLGIFIDEWIKKFISPLPKVHWRQIVLLFEIAMLSIVAWLPFGESHDIVANVLVSFVCSMQVQSFRKVMFVGNWNDFFAPSLYLTVEKVMTLQLMLKSLSDSKVDLPVSFAGAVIASVPLYVIYIIFQRYRAIVSFRAERR